jgi:uncharacterized membrane protein YphA (DoxX/SURF4 family)
MRIAEFAKRLNNPGLGLDLLRVYLGVALLVRGALFIGQPDALTSYMERSQHWFIPVAISHYVVAAHVAGGLLLILGLGTRVAAWAQVPILLGAVLFVHRGEGLLSASQSLELSALVLAMLVVIGVFGAGDFSVDHVLAKGAPPTTPSARPPAGHDHEAHAHT